MDYHLDLVLSQKLLTHLKNNDVLTTLVPKAVRVEVSTISVKNIFRKLKKISRPIPTGTLYNKKLTIRE